LNVLFIERVYGEAAGGDFLLDCPIAEHRHRLSVTPERWPVKAEDVSAGDCAVKIFSK
jgi:hypothetical protein